MSHFSSHNLIMAIEKPKVQPSAPIKKEKGNSPVSSWGEGNDFPQQIIDLVAKNTELAALLDWKSRALQGRAVIAVQQLWNNEQQRYEEKAINNPEIIDFLSSRMFKHYLCEASTDFFWFANIFPELIKNGAGDKIAYISTQDASHCRWGKMNEKGIIDTCFVSANWPDAKIEDETTLQIPVLDPYNPTIHEDLRAATEVSNFIYPVSYPSPGKSYYQLAPWDSWRTSGWPELAQMIPKSKVQLMKNLLSAKFILEIPLKYWAENYPNWHKMSDDERFQIKQQKVKLIDETLTGVGNTGKTILTEVGLDAGGRESQSWKILPIDDKLRDGNFLEDSREASQHLRSALGLDSALTGDGPGKGLGGGSGSDKRIALNIYVALQQPYREVLFEPIYFIAEYNGWTKKHPGFKLKTIEIQLETLDQSHQTAVPISN